MLEFVQRHLCINIKMALSLTGDEFELIRDAFFILDEDGDKFITRDEIAKCFSNLSDDMVDFYLRLLDMDGTGTIRFVEFLEMYAYFTLERPPHKTQIKQLFKALDKDGSGFISELEVRMFGKLFHSVEDCDIDSKIEDLISQLDSNGDGKIDYTEFVENYYELENSEFFQDK